MTQKCASFISTVYLPLKKKKKAYAYKGEYKMLSCFFFYFLSPLCVLCDAEVPNRFGLWPLKLKQTWIPLTQTAFQFWLVDITIKSLLEVKLSSNSEEKKNKIWIHPFFWKMDINTENALFLFYCLKFLALLHKVCIPQYFHECRINKNIDIFASKMFLYHKTTVFVLLRDATRIFVYACEKLAFWGHSSDASFCFLCGLLIFSIFSCFLIWPFLPTDDVWCHDYH